MIKKNNLKNTINITQEEIEEKSVSKEKKQTNFIWYATRVSFWLMIFFWGLAVIIPKHEGIWINDWAYVISVLFCFVCSIIHLVKHKEKALAITSLVISSIGLLLMIFGFIVGIVEGIQGI